MKDGYEVSGEFIDVLSGPAWQVLRDPVRAALRGVDPEHGPVLDVGAGTGLGTQILADACPAATVLAVEPSPVLRAVLLSRVAADADLRDRVTVLADDALGAPLPERLGAVLAANMIGHLPPQERREFWHRVAARLAPGAPLVVNLQPPAELAVVGFTTFGAVRIGRYTYEGGGAAEPVGAHTVTWRMSYRVLDAGVVLREHTVDYLWHVLSEHDLRAELAEAELRAEVGPMGVVRAVRAG
ncbi:class I SAM-dependent methyltransferase [Micromonospora sp. SL1-18]|uniref:class I SAM-dependent methyltransferase n=1 Tax=Micromonospora sp. SL1-18 TaxID=3399128 RepID=UPI003A4DD7CB